MARKKQTYGDMIRLIDEMQLKIKNERERMAGVMAAALLEDQAAVCLRLGEYSDADLRRVMSLLSGHIDECIRQLEAEKQAKHSQ